jgi:hypothetical protein
MTPRAPEGFTFLQFFAHVPVIPGLLWLFARTLSCVPPIAP